MDWIGVRHKTDVFSILSIRRRLGDQDIGILQSIPQLETTTSDTAILLIPFHLVKVLEQI